MGDERRQGRLVRVPGSGQDASEKMVPFGERRIAGGGTRAGRREERQRKED